MSLLIAAALHILIPCRLIRLLCLITEAEAGHARLRLHGVARLPARLYTRLYPSVAGVARLYTRMDRGSMEWLAFRLACTLEGELLVLLALFFKIQLL